MKVDKEKIKVGVWGAIGGAILTIIIGFSLGGWVLSGTAYSMAEEMAEDAVVDRLVPICVAQFDRDPERDKKLQELKEKSSWERDKYVEEQGWATMPYEKEPDSKVAKKCTEQIMQIGQ
ncbi:MAG: hypothetical protein PVF56_18360 [Desulfobacterales bacterium]|jgi:hypothetical protein